MGRQAEHQISVSVYLSLGAVYWLGPREPLLKFFVSRYVSLLVAVVTGVRRRKTKHKHKHVAAPRTQTLERNASYGSEVTPEALSELR